MLKIAKESLKTGLNTSAFQLSSRASSTWSVTSLSLRGPPKGSSLVMDTTTSSSSWRAEPNLWRPKQHTQTTNDLNDLNKKDVKTTKKMWKIICDICFLARQTKDCFRDILDVQPPPTCPPHAKPEVARTSNKSNKTTKLITNSKKY